MVVAVLSTFTSCQVSLCLQGLIAHWYIVCLYEIYNRNCWRKYRQHVTGTT
jgi:hypothetical protein